MLPQKEKTLDQLSANQQKNSPWLAWEAPEFEYYEKNWRWYVGLIMIVLALATWFYLTRNYSAIAVVTLAAILIYQHASRSPQNIKYTLDLEGFKIKDKLYSWDQLKSFWIVINQGSSHLYLETTNRPFTIKAVHLDNVDLDELRARLIRHLPEQSTYGERLTESFIRWFKL